MSEDHVTEEKVEYNNDDDESTSSLGHHTYSRSES